MVGEEACVVSEAVRVEGIVGEGLAVERACLVLLAVACLASSGELVLVPSQEEYHPLLAGAREEMVVDVRGTFELAVGLAWF